MNDQDYVIFEDYLSEKLNQEERVDFENRLKTNSKFNETFVTYKELSSFLEHKFEDGEKTEAFKDNLNSISNTHFKAKKADKKGYSLKPWQYAIAASFALLFGLFMFNQLSTPTYNDYADYGSISLAIRGTQNQLFTKAEKAFNTKDFSQSELYFTQILEYDNTNTEIKLYKGISLIELNKFNEADAILEKLKQGNSAYKNKAIWYLALSKLKQKDTEACLDILKTLSEDAEDFKQAQKLLKKLD